MIMKKNLYDIIKSGIIMMFAALAVTACSDYDPLDSYSRIPPDRTQSGNTEEGAGGLFEGGFGTEESPYIIMNATQLRNMSQALVAETTVYFELGADIDMKNSNWTPLNNAEGFVYFIDFDGAGHVIQNFSSRGHSYSSFFGALNGACRNVGFVNASIEGQNATGVICGYLGDNSGNSGHNGIIENCYATGTVENTGAPSGGLVGRSGTTSGGNAIRNCYSTVDVTGSGDSGGVIGQMYNVEVINCYSTGAIDAQTGSAGGVVSLFNNDAHANCTFQNVIGWNTSISGAGQGKVIGYVGADCTFESYAWDGIGNMDKGLVGWSGNRYHGEEIKTAAELLAIVQSWGSPWSATVSHNGFPLLEWLAARADYADVCGLPERSETEPEPEPEPETPTGTGVQADPYILTTVGHIQKMNELMKSGETVYFKLGNDIDMAEVNDWTPLNYADPYDKAIDFDGDGYTISNFKCSYSEYPSFFGVVNGSVRNVAFTDAEITSSTDRGAAVIGGYVGTAVLVGKVENVYVQGKITITTTAPAGGIAGNLRGTGSYIKNCHANMEIISSSTTLAQSGLGGIAGKIYGNVTIENCLAEGSIDGTIAQDQGDNVGGIYGRVESASQSNMTIKGCIAWQTRIDGRAATGRIGGRDYDVLTSQSCYARTDMELCQDGNRIELSAAYGQAEQGTDCSDIISTAQNTLGWDSGIWDFSGATPQLKCFNK